MGAARRRLVSEPLTPAPGSFDPIPMGRGEPGVPRAFEWRGTVTKVAEVQSTWKRTGPGEGGLDTYLRRHFYEMRMEDGSIWTVYCMRQTPGGPRATRWFLYTIESPDRPESTGAEP